MMLQSIILNHRKQATNHPPLQEWRVVTAIYALVVDEVCDGKFRL